MYDVGGLVVTTDILEFSLDLVDSSLPRPVLPPSPLPPAPLAHRSRDHDQGIRTNER